MNPAPARPSIPQPGALKLDEEFLRHPSLPGRLQELVGSYIARKTGKPWDDPVVLDRIRAAVRAQKGEYWDQAGGKAISYRAGYRVLAYLAYQAPVAFVQAGHLLHDLAADGLLKDRMRVLDMGAGPGTVSLAVIDSWGRLSPGDVWISAVERETENLEAYRFIVPAFASGNPRVRVADPIQADLQTLDPGDLPPDIDLLVFANVLNELRDLTIGKRGALVERCASVLAGDGTVIITEPADLENSLALRRLTGELARRGLSVYAPCTPIWSSTCSPDRCWTFREAPPLTPPGIMHLLSSAPDGYRYRNTDIKFSYAVMRRDGRTRERYRVPATGKAIRLSKLQGHLKRRVNVVVARMSGDLGDRGTHVFKVCDGTPQKPVFAIVPDHHASGARALLEGRYGEVLALENILVRFNPARDAYNLFFDREARAVGPARVASPSSLRRRTPGEGKGEGRGEGKGRGKGRRGAPK
ncbi:MAG TPA: hypothetical protein VEI51_06985 [Methanomicrobiales archaeon]|nr:hypothetical protein [Methanomicrobiales archaeon]